MRARHRVEFWATQGFANLKRASTTRWVMHRRHWPDGPWLQDCMADLSAELPPPPKRRKSRKPSK
jgi:hypothetical protein